MGIKTYVVKKGDTLSAIARDHIGEASQYKEIAKINGINNTEMINVGDVLKIPVPSEGKVETLDLDEISKESSQPGESNKEKGNTITQKPYNAQNPYMQKKETPKEDAIQEKSIMQKEYQASNPYIQKQEEGKTEFLKNYGFGEEDIKRIERGEIEVEELIKEVNEDKNPERRKKLMEKGYLMMYGQSTELDITDMEELKKAYEKVKVGLKESREELKEIERENSGVTEQVLKKIEEGKTLEEILKSQVAWRYKDKEGNVKYIYNTPTQISAAAASGVNDGRKYEAVYGSEIGEEEIESLKQVLSNGNSYKGSDQEKEALRKIKEKSIEKEKNKEKRKKDLEDKIGWLEEKHGLYKDVIEKVEYEVDYYFTYQDRYVLKEDFNNQNKIKGEVREKAKELFDVSKYRLDEKTGETKHEGYGNVKLEGDGSYTVNDKEAVVALISSIINETGEVEYDGTLKVGGENGHVITSGDLLLTNYGQWLAYMSETEKGIFNYILNTEGYEKAYKYLDDVAYYFDNKWVEERSKKDEEFADNHGVLASLASAASGWVGGAEAFFHSTYSAIQGQKIRKTNTYNPMDTYRSKVSLNIREKSEELAFLYDTGMSMADSGMMMALTAGMGTAGRAATSTLLMGSRAYVSTLNENLDRGLSDGEAILTAIASAATDAAMEAYSAGHLMNLEEKLGEGAMRAVDAAGRATKNEAVNEILQKGTYVLMSAGSQGITEAEEEMTTEIVNELIDRGVIKDKSQYEERIKWYQELGYTENESKGKANVEFINRVKQASLGGLLSGVTFGAVGGALNVKGGALDGSRVEVGKVGREDVETVQTKIENDVSVKEESNVNHNVDSKVKTSVEADLKRYNEIMDIMKTEEYQEYKYNYEHGYAQVLREDFNKIEAELKVLEKRLGDHISKQASQANISTANIPRNYVSFSKNFIESIDQMSQYYGDAGYTVNSLFLKGNTIQQIFSQLDRQSQMDFYNFLQNTREGRYLASLSADEIRSLCIYTWGSYRTINEKLRSEKISGKINGIEAQTLVNNMDSAIAKFGGLETPMELYRAVDVKSFTSQNSTYKALFEGIDITDLNQVYSVLKVLEGKEFGDLGYMSASPGYSTSFAKQDDYPIVLDIIADKGTPGAYINQISTFYNGENEFLLAHGMKLEMLEVSPPQRDINGLEKIIVKCVVK